MSGVDGYHNSRELLRSHYAGQTGAFISNCAEFCGGLAAFSVITPVPIWNHAAWIGGTQDDFSTFLYQTQSWQNEKNRRPVIYVAEPSRQQVAALEEAGYEKFDEESWMVLASAAVSNSSLRVREAVDEKEVNDFVSVFYSSFQIKQDGYERALRRSLPNVRHFVLYQDSLPVCGGTLITQDARACVYNLGTPTPHRGNGFGAELMKHLTAVATASGCQTVFLQVEKNSSAQRLYEKCGFTLAFTRSGYRLRQWKPRDITRTRLSSVLGCPSASEEILFARETRPLALNARSLAGCSLAQISCAAWAFLLHRYTGEENVSFTRRIGGNVNEPIQMRISRFLTVKRWLEEGPISSSSPEAQESLLCLDSVTQNHFTNHTFPIELHVTGSEGDSIEIVYRTDLFTKDAIRRLGSHFATILESILTGPQTLVGQLEILPPHERHQLFAEWNHQDFQLTDRCIHQLFEQQVENTPDGIALSLAKTGRAEPAVQLTYRQLNRRANRLAHRLQALGVGPDVFVGVCLERSPEMIVALLAILKAGGVCVPLDPAYPVERLAFILNDTRAPVLLTESAFACLFPGATAKVILLDDASSPQSSESERNLVSQVLPVHAAYVIYTSGSTGQPKGVVVPHHAIANHSIDCRKVYGLSARDRVLQFSSFNFDASFEQILPALISGATLVLRDGEAWSTREFEKKLAQFQLTVTDIPTAYWHQLAEEWFKAGTVPSNCLRLVIVGGEAPSPEKLALWQQTAMNKVRFINAYGPTETTITATSYEVPSRKPGDQAPIQLPIGRPRGDRRAYVLDPFGSPTPIGVPGELHIGGTLLARGYHNRPELTETRFISNPFSDEPDARLYKTGDLVRYLEDGNLEFLGRIDDQVKIRGFRIELGEVENSLRLHPAVRDAAVLVRQNSGGSEKRLVAYVVLNGRPISQKDLRAFLQSRLPEYMVPGAIVLLDEFPLLPSGKIDRRSLPEPPEVLDDSVVHGPRDPLELQVKLIFERVLKRVPIGIDVSFFELGGDSLQALELLVELERATGKQLPLGTLYQSSTVETIARELRERSTAADQSCLVPLQTSGNRPPLLLLHTTPGDILGYGNLVYRLGPDQPCYGLQSIALTDPKLSHHTISEMASFYVKVLREAHPHGPYYLGGWCYGGIVAVEMARLLRQEGEEIPLLALLETVALPPKITNWRYFAHRFGCFLGMSPARWLTYFRAKARYLRQARIDNRKRFRQVESSVTAEEPGARAERLAKLEHVYNTNLKALDSYRSNFYDGKVVLFNAAERDPAIIPDPQYGWVGLAREIEIHDVPGNHDTMLTEPNVSMLARKLSECLIKAHQSFTKTNP